MAAASSPSPSMVVVVVVVVVVVSSQHRSHELVEDVAAAGSRGNFDEILWNFMENVLKTLIYIVFRADSEKHG